LTNAAGAPGPTFEMRILVLDDGIRGNFVQAAGIAYSFSGAEVCVAKIRLRGPCYVLPGRAGRYEAVAKILAFFCVLRMWRLGYGILRFALDAARSGQIEGRWDVVISAGSRLAPVNLLIARRGDAAGVTVMTPSLLPLHLFDAAVIPRHDAPRVTRSKDRIIVTRGAPNMLNPGTLARGGQRLRERLGAEENAVFLGLLVGGNDQNYVMTREWISSILDAVSKGDAGVLMTSSRRTPPEVIGTMQRFASGSGRVAYAEFPPADVSHYPGILALSSVALVTEDSINMVSEAITAGAATVILGVPRRRRKRLVFDATIRELVEGGYAVFVPAERISDLSETIREVKKVNFRRLDEARRCAKMISEKIRTR